MKNEPLISVIIPMYNAEEYISNCISSILKTSVPIELIIVDDESTDKSVGVVKSIVDDRIKLFSKVNEGAFMAWRYGLSKSVGKYVVFVDADDYLEPSVFDFIKETIETYEYDLIVYGMEIIKKDSKMLFPFNIGEGEYIGKNFQDILPKLIPNYNSESILSSRCNKAFKRNILTEIDFSYLNGTRFLEDMAVVYTYVYFIKSMFVSHTAYYKYNQLENSVSHRGSNNELISNYVDVIRLNNFFDKNSKDINSDYSRRLYFKSYFILFNKMLSCKKYGLAKVVLEDQRFYNLFKETK